MFSASVPRETSENRWAEWIEPQWIDQLDATPFLTSCRQGTVSLAALQEFAVQQFFYARHFTRYLCALLANIENEDDRLELCENLVDETGLGKDQGIPHSQLYRAMLRDLGWNPQGQVPRAETRALIDTMFESCRNPNPAIGLGALCLGAEAIVPHVYRQILQGFESQGYSDHKLEFFRIHVACDDAHALTMKQIIERELASPAQKLALRCSAARAIAARARFFGALTPERQRLYA